MSNDNIDKLFETLKGNFDVEAPNSGHQQRFLDKLNNANKTVTTPTKTRRLWSPFVGIAASVVILIGLFLGIQTESNAKDLASISPEMAKTQSFFTATIAEELDKLKDETSPETKVLVNDALKQLDLLEAEYDQLKTDLSESGDDKRVIYAMISNFQNRIDLLQNVLQKIEEVKQLKQNTNENASTI